MKSLWNDKDAKKYGKSLLAKRVYTSRLLGANPNLVLHGGGNTSVKIKKKDFYGISKEYLYVKGSGCDLATINEADFSACDIQDLLSLSSMEDLSDTNMVSQSRASMLDPNSLTPSIEAIVHAVIPSKYVDHTHADSILSLTNCPNGRKNISDLFGDSVIVVPYVMPGFDLAKEVKKQIQKSKLNKVEGMILMNHGIFTFDDDARSSYEKMIRLVSRAERFIKKKIAKKKLPVSKLQGISPNDLSQLRKVVSEWRGHPVLASLDNDIKSTEFACLKNIKSISTRGPLTPDHVIRTKRTPAIIGSNIVDSIDKYVDDYTKYFNRHASSNLTMLDPAPRWAIWPNKGIVYFGKNDKEISIIRDIVRHTIKTIQQTELAFGSWKALSASKLFDIEYWELEQAKLKSKDSHGLPHEGKVAIVTGSAAGIGLSLALCCDLMIMSDDAFLLAPFTSISLAPDGGMNWFLVHQLGYRKAFQICIESERISAEYCVDNGLANKCVRAENLFSETLIWAKNIAKRAPLSVTATKKVMRYAASHSWSETYDMEVPVQQKLIDSNDFKEGVRAFIEKREPGFNGD